MSWLSALEPFLFCKHYFNIFLDDLVENVFTQAEIMFSATRLCFFINSCVCAFLWEHVCICVVMENSGELNAEGYLRQTH